MKKDWFYLCLCAVIVVANEEAPSRVVKTSNGAVRGFLQEGVYQFLDLPYAMAPVGAHRFGPPLPSPIWLATHDAVDTGIICPQATIPGFALNKKMDDNCLLTSVYVPDTKQEKLPVVVYVHGGGFQMGYGNWLKPIEIVKEHDIIAVTFNYRLGVYGFLCLGTDDIPGNAGLKDQVALLRWVQKNIEKFGGNPNDVTIAGYSAGGSSVDLLMLSKSAEGLFNKVIPESGSNLAPFAIQSDPLETAMWFAKSLNFNNVNDIHALEEFYKSATREQLTSNSFYDMTDSTFKFGPCVENPPSYIDRFHGKEPFLVHPPSEILIYGDFKKVPVLVGFANMEGLLRTIQFDDWKTRMNEKFSDFLPANLIFDNEEDKENVTKKIKEFYFGVKPVGNDNILKYVDYFSDIMFNYPALRSLKLQVEHGHNQIYLYEYNYVDDQVPKVPHTEVRGANHAAQTIAVFAGRTFGGEDMKIAEEYKKQMPIITEEFKKFSSTIRQIWANFIKTGQPVPPGSELPAWPPVRSKWSPHMSLGKEIKLKDSLLLERARFWEDIYNRYYRHPIPPPMPMPKHSEL